MYIMYMFVLAHTSILVKNTMFPYTFDYKHTYTLSHTCKQKMWLFISYRQNEAG